MNDDNNWYVTAIIWVLILGFGAYNILTSPGGGIFFLAILCMIAGYSMKK